MTTGPEDVTRRAITDAWDGWLRHETEPLLGVTIHNAVAQAVGEWLDENHDAVIAAIREANS